MIFSFLIVFSFVALWYTVFNSVSLFSFCHYKLLYVRNWACSSWDQLQQAGIAGLIFHDRINSAVQHILEGNNTFVLNKLLHYLTVHKTNTRDLHVDPPDSTFSSREEEIFGRSLSECINRSSRVIEHFQGFDGHIIGTVEIIISNTKQAVQELADAGLDGQTFANIDESGTKSMLLFSSYCLIYLLTEIAPVRQS